MIGVRDYKVRVITFKFLFWEFTIYCERLT